MVAWFAAHGRDLPWRAPGTDPWAVLVCEVMSHQTPVARVVPVWLRWLTRWPDASALADDSPGEAVRMWGRLGYPRRALRLHETAVAVRDGHGGVVPGTYEELLALPGVGPYTAGAVAAFGFGRRAVVLDVNVRRVLARVHDGADPTAAAPTVGERARAEALLPVEASTSVAWNAAVMELGALVCTARAPRCPECPLQADCAWAADPPPARSRTTRRQPWHGTDRQVRGRIMALLRASHGLVEEATLLAVCDDPAQARRCLDSLAVDGLAERADDGVRLPL
ncbi:A/G-specific adenine glycosylase [Aquipuribacter nitratireducens]|uniref:Adenine DNA glycosylase n=1 Tax=Aquipuribacter nitratireducens TaxID=650104 RepID=A0ABW0GRD6_9MICO